MVFNSWPHNPLKFGSKVGCLSITLHAVITNTCLLRKQTNGWNLTIIKTTKRKKGISTNQTSIFVRMFHSISSFDLAVVMTFFGRVTTKKAKGKSGRPVAPSLLSQPSRQHLLDRPCRQVSQTNQCSDFENETVEEWTGHFCLSEKNGVHVGVQALRFESPCESCLFFGNKTHNAWVETPSMRLIFLKILRLNPKGKGKRKGFIRTGRLKIVIAWKS